MADPQHPLRFLPAGVAVERPQRRGGPQSVRRPERDRQRERLEPAFARLQQALDDRRLRLRETAEGGEPEMVLVLEIASTVPQFVQAVSRIDGLEWLAEIGDDDLEPDDDFGPLKEGQAYQGTMYLLFTDALALQQLLSSWQRWQDGGRQLPGRTPLRDVIDLLIDIRPWDARDRVRETGLEEEVSIVPAGQAVRVEVELWYRAAPAGRVAAQRRVGDAIRAAGGSVLDEAVIDEARYHGVLARLSRAAAEALVVDEPTVRLALVDDVMYLRPQPQGVLLPDADDAPLGSRFAPVAGPSTALPRPELPPILALLDGVPQANHPDLADRLTVEDPDDLEAQAPAAGRRHGTAMASLIARGDLSAPGTPLRRRVLVRPVLKPDPDGWRSPRLEVFPRDELLAAFLHRVLQELFGGPAAGSSAASTVEIVNLSIGDPGRIYAQALSPLARLLDWAADRFSLLIIVSAGNHPGELRLDPPHDVVAGHSPTELEIETVRALHRDSRLRRLLSPAEAVNVLTAGAAADDLASVGDDDDRVDPVGRTSLPAPYSALGGGHRRGIKPDVLLEGGRLRYRLRAESDGDSAPAILEAAPAPASPPGQLVAAPGLPAPRRLYSTGTSNAAALASRLAAELWETVTAMPEQPDWLTRSVRPNLVRAMLVHAARWGTALDLVNNALAVGNGEKPKRLVERLVGYGRIDRSRITTFHPHRVVLLAGGEIAAGEAREHQVPLPASLSSIHGQRRIVSTLAWTSPCNGRNQRYRGVSLKLADGSASPLTNMLSEGADFRTSQRGTVEHHVKRGVSAVPLEPDAALHFRVDCAADAVADPPRVPYGLVVTLEVAPELGVDVYTEVANRLAFRAAVRPR